MSERKVLSSPCCPDAEVRASVYANTTVKLYSDGRIDLTGEIEWDGGAAVNTKDMWCGECGRILYRVENAEGNYELIAAIYETTRDQV